MSTWCEDTEAGVKSTWQGRYAIATISTHPRLVLLGLHVVPVSNHLGVEQGLLVEDVLDVSCLR